MKRRGGVGLAGQTREKFNSSNSAIPDPLCEGVAPQDYASCSTSNCLVQNQSFLFKIYRHSLIMKENFTDLQEYTGGINASTCSNTLSTVWFTCSITLRFILVWLLSNKRLYIIIPHKATIVVCCSEGGGTCHDKHAPWPHHTYVHAFPISPPYYLWSYWTWRVTDRLQLLFVSAPKCRGTVLEA